MAKQNVANEEQITVSQALEILQQNEVRKQKKRDALKKWRKQHKSEYNEYIKQWRAKQKAKVERAEKIIADNEAKLSK